MQLNKVREDKMIKNDFELLHAHSTRKYKLAWALEILVVTIGLAISVTLALESRGFLGWSSIIVTVGPFVVVALVELCKIPLASALYFSRKSKILYLIFAIFVSAITFETLFNGFERNLASLNYEIDLKKLDIARAERTMEINEQKILDLETNINQKKDEVLSLRDDINSKYQKDISRIRSSRTQNESLLITTKNDIATIRAKIREMQTLKLAKTEEWIEKKKALFDRLAESGDSLSESVIKERQQLSKRISELEEEYSAALDEANFFTRQGVVSRYEKQIENLRNTLQSVTEKSLDSSNLTANIQSKQHQLDLVNKQYEMYLSDLDASIKEQKEQLKILEDNENRLHSATSSQLSKKINQRFQQKEKELGYIRKKESDVESENQNVFDKITELKNANFDIEHQISTFKHDLDFLIMSNQVYRIASYVDNAESADEISKESVKMVALIWFGSLAMVCSITGIILVLSSFHMRDMSIHRNQLHQEKLALDKPIDATL